MPVRSRTLMVVACAACALALVLPAAAVAEPIALASIPATVTRAVPFAVAGTVDVPGAVTVRAVTVAPPEMVVTVFASVISTPEAPDSFSAILSLPRGGDWNVYAIASGVESPALRVSCDPAAVSLIAAVDRTKVAYDTPAIFSATVFDTSGSRVGGAGLDLCAIDAYGRAHVVRRYTADASGTIRARINNGGRYFGSPYYNVYRTVRWAWRYPDSGWVGSVSSSACTTTATFKLLRSEMPSTTVSGKTKLSRGHRYEFVFNTAEQFEPGRLLLVTPSRRTVLDSDIKQRSLPTWHKPFSAKTTGYYRWKLTGIGAHASSWSIW